MDKVGIGIALAVFIFLALLIGGRLIADQTKDKS